jgi:hypothetical protein
MRIAKRKKAKIHKFTAIFMVKLKKQSQNNEKTGEKE